MKKGEKHLSLIDTLVGILVSAIKSNENPYEPIHVELKQEKYQEDLAAYRGPKHILDHILHFLKNIPNLFSNNSNKFFAQTAAIEKLTAVKDSLEDEVQNNQTVL